MNVTLRRSVAAAAVVLLPLLTSCGFDKPTDRVYNPGVGVNDRSGAVDVLHALVVADGEGSGTVVAGLVNTDSTEADQLTQVAGSGADSSVSVSMSSPVEIPADSLVQIADKGVDAQGKAIEAGSFVELTFSFENAESVTLQVPVVAPRGDFADVPLPSEESSSPASPSESASESPSASPSESPGAEG